MQNTCNEEWKDVQGYEGLYQISNQGNVKSIDFGSPTHKKRCGVKCLKPILNHSGYYVVTLYKNGVSKQVFIHRLVAETFIPNPQNLPVVDHINTDTKDNREENLRWVTVKGNVNNELSVKKRIEAIQKRFKGKTGVDSITHKEIAQYALDGVTLIKVWKCMSDAWRQYGIDSSCLTRACQGRQKTAAGFIWRYVIEQADKDSTRKDVAYQQFHGCLLTTWKLFTNDPNIAHEQRGSRSRTKEY